MHNSTNRNYRKTSKTGVLPVANTLVQHRDRPPPVLPSEKKGEEKKTRGEKRKKAPRFARYLTPLDTIFLSSKRGGCWNLRELWSPPPCFCHHSLKCVSSIPSIPRLFSFFYLSFFAFLLMYFCNYCCCCCYYKYYYFFSCCYLLLQILLLLFLLLLLVLLEL